MTNWLSRPPVVVAVRRGYVAKDLLDHSHLVLRAAGEALGRPRPSDPGPWLSLVASSLYAPAGRRSFLGRLRANWTHLPRDDQRARGNPGTGVVCEPSGADLETVSRAFTMIWSSSLSATVTNPVRR